ncbi:hypothetical protein DFAR_1340044 [Desulfarculales bacterium]
MVGRGAEKPPRAKYWQKTDYQGQRRLRIFLQGVDFREVGHAFHWKRST